MTKTRNANSTEQRLKPSPLFSFAVLSDTHVGPVDGVSPSPWSSNRLANARARAAVSRLNALAPDFVIHLGDMVHPTPDQPRYEDSAARFAAIFDRLEMPLYLMPGNHDIGDMHNPWTPAKICEAAFIDRYKSIFGADRQAFSHQGIRFILIDSQILNSGTSQEAEQWHWLESELRQHMGERIFVFGHQPLRLTANDETMHYDNTAEPARGRMLALLRRHRVEAWLSGHVHTFFYDREEETDLYVVPAVSALRLDYAELFKVPPPKDDEFGRNDTPKLGFVLIEVFEDRHVLHHIRSYGETQEEDVAAPTVAPPPLLHPRQGIPTPIGVELRDPWANTIDIAYSGVVDAFTRKPVRNDYRLLGLWEMGLTHLRVPVEDLRDPATLARVRTLKQAGHRFSTFLYGLPDTEHQGILARAADALDKVNIILPPTQIAAAAPALETLRHDLKRPVFLSSLRSSAEHGNTVAGNFAHAIDHGFIATDLDQINAIGLIPGASPFVDGLVFQTRHEEMPSDIVPDLISAMAARCLSFSLTVKMGGSNPAQLSGTRETTAALACDALEMASTLPPGCEVILDTLTDVDRGYFPRFGLLDRRMNPTLASDAFMRRHAELLGRS